MCAEDILFWTNSFVFTYNPRLKESPVVPFNTYPFQDAGLLEMRQVLGKQDFLLEKSRDMGVSWQALLLIAHSFLFDFHLSFLVASRKEDLVDKTNDPDSLFYKIDFILKHLPWWMMPRIERSRLHFANLDNGSTIDGSSTTSDLGRGGRRTVVVLDEFAFVDESDGVMRSTRNVTDCRLLVSTPNGTGNAFYRLVQNPRLKKITYHWSIHPVKNRGLYTSHNGKVIHLDDRAFEIEFDGKTYKIPEDWDYVTGPTWFDPRHYDGKLRSPYYDIQCQRTANPNEIAQEEDIDYLGSDYQFFDSAILRNYKEDFCRMPLARGDLKYTLNETGDKPEFTGIRFDENPEGKLLLWELPESSGAPRMDTYYRAACDIATGTGASNSVGVIGSTRTNEVVAEYADPNISPEKFAELMVAMCYWYHSARMIWEANGPGRIFGNRVIELGYRNFYYKDNDKEIAAKKSSIPGWWTTPDNKVLMLGALRSVMSQRKFICRSTMLLEECERYIFFKNNNTVGHAESGTTDDPSGARDNHGDRVIATSLLWQLMVREQVTTIVQERKPVPVSCLFARRQQRVQQKRNRRRY